MADEVLIVQCTKPHTLVPGILAAGKRSTIVVIHPGVQVDARVTAAGFHNPAAHSADPQPHPAIHACCAIHPAPLAGTHGCVAKVTWRNDTDGNGGARDPGKAARVLQGASNTLPLVPPFPLLHTSHICALPLAFP